METIGEIAAVAAAAAALGAWSNGNQIGKLRGRVDAIETTQQTMLTILATGARPAPPPTYRPAPTMPTTELPQQAPTRDFGD
jgi:hypothetical protein